MSRKMRIRISVKRDVILENDRTFIDNCRALNRRVYERKITHHDWRNIYPTLVMGALRRAGVPFRESREMLRA
jgi:hypothetical protein